MHLFYTPDINSEVYQLGEEESKHCVRVLRLQIGDQVNLIDGSVEVESDKYNSSSRHSPKIDMRSSNSAAVGSALTMNPHVCRTEEVAAYIGP